MKSQICLKYLSDFSNDNIKGDYMEEVLKISAFCIAAVLIVLLVKSLKPEMGAVVLIAVTVVIFTYIAMSLDVFFDAGKDIIDKTGLDNEQISLLFKIIASVYILEFARGICMDSGEIGMAQKIDMCGRVYLIVLILPTCVTLITTIISFIR